jgi:hypothetical protein
MYDIPLLLDSIQYFLISHTIGPTDLLQQHTTNLSRYFRRILKNIHVSAPYNAVLQMQHFTRFFIEFKANLLMKTVFFFFLLLLNAAFVMTILDLLTDIIKIKIIPTHKNTRET